MEDEMENKCPRCGAYLDNGICPYCGYEAVEQDSVINNEDTEVEQPVIQPVIQIQSNPQPGVVNVRVVSSKSRTVALVLCLFFGLLGAHRFYSGKIVSGIIYIITGGLFFFGMGFDLIMILLGGFKDSDGLPIKEW